MLTGPLPTPAIAYLTRALRLQAGVVISASHNPVSGQRDQVFFRRGQQASRRRGDGYRDPADRPMHCKDSASLGKARRVEDARGPLHRVLQEHVSFLARPFAE